MKWSPTFFRLRSVWLFVPIFLILAEPTDPLLLAGGALAVLGGMLRAWAAGTVCKNRILTTTGPYAHTRNPLYLGSSLVGLGVVVGSGSPWLFILFVVFFTVVYGRTMRAEERFLAERFGAEFERYAAEVPLFFPRLRPYRSGVAEGPSFDLQRYLRHREWELALGLALAFLVLWGKTEWF